MTHNDYQKLAFRTCKITDSEKFDLLHMAVGIGSEYNELIKAIKRNDITNIIEEIGDMFWYISGCCSIYNIKLNEVVVLNDKRVLDYLELLPLAISTIQDNIKKDAIYGKGTKYETIYQLKYLILLLQSMLNVIHVSIETVYTTNINKLKVRYPEKYSDINAIQRDLFKEYEQLSKQ